MSEDIARPATIAIFASIPSSIDRERLSIPQGHLALNAQPLAVILELHGIFNNPPRSFNRYGFRYGLCETKAPSFAQAKGAVHPIRQLLYAFVTISKDTAIQQYSSFEGSIPVKSKIYEHQRCDHSPQ